MTLQTTRIATILAAVIAFAVNVSAVELPVGGDAFVDSSAPASNFGSQPYLQVGGTTRAFLSFELSTLPADVNAPQAILLLWVNRVVAPGSIQASLATSAWSESSITSAAQPSTSGVINTVGTPTASSLVAIDVTNAFHAWLSSPATNFGLVLDLAAPGTEVYADSKESGPSGHPPLLEIIGGGGTTSPTSSNSSSDARGSVDPTLNPAAILGASTANPSVTSSDSQGYTQIGPTPSLGVNPNISLFAGKVLTVPGGARALQVGSEYDGSQVFPNSFYGIQSYVGTGAVSTGAITGALIGAAGQVFHYGKGTATLAYGILGNVQGGAASGNISDSAALFALSPAVPQGATWGTHSGLWIRGGGVSGTLTTRYGLRVDTLTGGTKRIGVYSQSDPMQNGPQAYSHLPACAAGMEGAFAAVNDSVTNIWGAAVSGGGSNHVQVYCDGTNWTVSAK